MKRTRKEHEAEEEHADHVASKRKLPDPSSDMNVTPLIDVLLVLLVIFLSALPLAQRGEDINLPPEVDRTAKPPDATQVIAEYTADHHLMVNKQPMPPAGQELEAKLRDIFEQRSDKVLFLMGDGTVRYGEIFPIIDAAIGAGAKVAIVTDGMKREAGR